MSETPQPNQPAGSPPEGASTLAEEAGELAWLIPVIGEANVRRMLETPVTEDQRERIRAIVKAAPRRLAGGPS